MRFFFRVSAFFVSLLAVCAVGYAHEITLEWDETRERGVDGYRLYYGKETGEYPAHQNVGLEACHSGTCTATVTVPDGRWYFAVTAHNSVNESDYSNEVAARAGSGLIQPILDIKVNGKDGPLTAGQENIRCTLSINAGDFTGTPYEWWLGLYWNQQMFWWIKGRRMLLSDMAPTVLFDGTLPEGNGSFFIYLYETPQAGSNAVIRQDKVHVRVK